MISLSKGKIEIGEKIILTSSSHSHLDELAKKGLNERRPEPNGGSHYFYFETTMQELIFEVIVSLREKRIDWILLRWLDGPCTSKGWDDVTEKALTDEYRFLSNFVQDSIKRPPDHRKNRQGT